MKIGGTGKKKEYITNLIYVNKANRNRDQQCAVQISFCDLLPLKKWSFVYTTDYLIVD